MNDKQSFAGDKKVGESVLTPVEKKLKDWLVPKIPPHIETYHLTMTTVLWSAGVVLFGYLASLNRHWVWMISLMIVLQYITDLADGEVGRRRDTGLIKWGFYMDHFLDYIFLCCLVFAGYLMAPESAQIWFIPLLIIMGAFMANSFLSFAATNEFEIYHYSMGPTESRLGFIAINAYISFVGFKHFHWLMPLVCAVTLVALVVYTWQIHKKLWAIDMQVKAER